MPLIDPVIPLALLTCFLRPPMHPFPFRSPPSDVPLLIPAFANASVSLFTLNLNPKP